MRDGLALHPRRENTPASEILTRADMCPSIDAVGAADTQATSRFLADLTHEMRTPLNAIIGFAELMAAEALGPLGVPRYQTYAQDIAACGNHLLELVNQILDLAKAEAGTLDLDEEIIDLNQIVGQATTFLGDMIRAADLDLQVDLPETPLPVRVDRRLILQILLNLLANAKKFTPRGGHIRVATGLDHNGAPWFAVADDGPGIPSWLSEQLLAACPTQLPPSGPSGGSAGLGLRLCRRFIERHGGRLRIDSAPRTGACVTALLPPSRRPYLD